MNAIMLQPQALPAVMEYAAQLVASGFLPTSINTAQKAVAIITLGYELGLSPWAAINGVNVIQGKPTISPALMLGLINRSGFLEDMTIDADDKGATVTMKRIGRTAHTETFTFEDARGMGLTGKDNYKKQPRVMLKWRAVSACARVVFPDVLAGLYTTEEIAPDNTTVTDDGEMTYAPSPTLESGTPALRHGDKAAFDLMALEVKQGDHKPFLAFTTNNPDIPKVYAYTRKLFQDANWCDENDWTVVGFTEAFTPHITVQAEYTATKDGGYWTVCEVEKLDVDFMTAPAASGA